MFGFYANKQLTTGEGGIVTSGPLVKEQIDSERNQGRAPDMGWLDHDRLGFNYRLSDLACALGLAQLERLDAMLAGRAGVAELYTYALAGIEVLSLPCAERSGRRAAGSSSSCSCRAASTATRPCARSGTADPEQALLPGDPPDELLPPAVRPSRGRVSRLRGRRGTVDRAAVLPGMTEGQVTRVAAARRRAGAAPADGDRGPLSRFGRAPKRRASAAERLNRLRLAAWSYDVAQSLAHASMLAAQGIICEPDRAALVRALERVPRELRDGSFPFAADDEDIHMAIDAA